MKWSRAVWAGLMICGSTVMAAPGDFSLHSKQLVPNGRLGDTQILQGFGCDGGNISPQLSWKNSPAGTGSYAVTVYDPDAPTGSGWWHWVIFNIPSDVKALPLNAGNGSNGLAPEGSVQSRTDFGAPGYGGGCPPEGAGDHRYIFTVYALDTPSLNLDAEASAAMVGYFIHEHVIGEASLTVYYSR